MEFDGLAIRYPVNRPLTDEERSLRVVLYALMENELSVTLCSGLFSGCLRMAGAQRHRKGSERSSSNGA